MDTQRKTIYGVRQEVLEGEDLKGKVVTMIEGAVHRSAGIHSDDPDGFKEWCLKTFGLEITSSAAELATDSEAGDIDPTYKLIEKRYADREEEFGDDLARRIESYILLNAIDSRWKDHLKAIDSLKVGIGLRGYGQEDPKTAYKKEGTDLFQNELLPAIENEVASLILRIQVQKPEDESPDEASAGAPSGSPDGLKPHGMVPQGTARPITPGGAVPPAIEPGTIGGHASPGPQTYGQTRHDAPGQRIERVRRDASPTSSTTGPAKARRGRTTQSPARPSQALESRIRRHWTQ